jgi:hypothetical protein
MYTARKAFQFANAHVTGWIREEVPAIPVDMVIYQISNFECVNDLGNID